MAWICLYWEDAEREFAEANDANRGCDDEPFLYSWFDDLLISFCNKDRLVSLEWEEDSVGSADTESGSDAQGIRVAEFDGAAQVRCAV